MSFRFFNSTGQEQIINSVADLPVGAIIDSALPNAPTGWLLCDGSSISRTGFPELFAAIGTFYGSVDANTFTLPDLTGQIIYARPYSLRTSNGLYVDDNSITSAKLAAGVVGAGGVLDVRDEKAAGTAGGTFTSGAQQTRTLNTTAKNTITGASLATNQITLPAGTYFVQATAPAYAANNHQARLYNTTDSSVAILGTTEFSFSTGAAGTSSVVNGVFTITATKVFELQHRCSSTATTNGFGAQANFGTTEVYAQVMIFKLS